MTADLAWTDQALCASVGGDIWFPEKGDSSTPAKAICARCPVAAQCLAVALTIGHDHGIWGGLSPRQRRNLRRAA